MRRVVKAAWTATNSPRVGVLLARMIVWRLALPALRCAVPLPTVVRLISPRPQPRARSPETELLVIDLAQRVFGAPRSADRRCLDRSLLVYRFLSRANANPRLVLGLGRCDGQTIGHAWVTVDGSPVHDSVEMLAKFKPFTTFGGQRQDR